MDEDQHDHGWDNPNYESDKDLTRLTHEALPSPDNFNNKNIDKKEDVSKCLRSV